MRALLHVADDDDDDDEQHEHDGHHAHAFVLKRLCIFVVDVGGGCCCVVCEIERGARSYACHCSNGHAPIHKAAEGGHISTVELLISKSANVHVQNK